MTDFALKTLPKSAELVLSSLKNNPKTQKQLLREISLSPRTLRFAITRLKNLELIKEINSLRDARIKFYKLKKRR